MSIALRRSRGAQGGRSPPATMSRPMHDLTPAHCTQVLTIAAPVLAALDERRLARRAAAAKGRVLLLGLPDKLCIVEVVGGAIYATETEVPVPRLRSAPADVSRDVVCVGGGRVAFVTVNNYLHVLDAMSGVAFCKPRPLTARGCARILVGLPNGTLIARRAYNKYADAYSVTPSGVELLDAKLPHFVMSASVIAGTTGVVLLSVHGTVSVWYSDKSEAAREVWPPPCSGVGDRCDAVHVVNAGLLALSTDASRLLLVSTEGRLVRIVDGNQSGIHNFCIPLRHGRFGAIFESDVGYVERAFNADGDEEAGHATDFDPDTHYYPYLNVNHVLAWTGEHWVAAVPMTEDDEDYPGVKVMFWTSDIAREPSNVWRKSAEITITCRVYVYRWSYCAKTSWLGWVGTTYGCEVVLGAAGGILS